MASRSRFFLLICPVGVEYTIMTSRDKGGHRYNRLTWMWSRRECATNHHLAEGHRPEASPATPPRHTQDTHSSNGAVVDLTPGRDAQGKQYIVHCRFVVDSVGQQSRPRPYPLM